MTNADPYPPLPPLGQVKSVDVERRGRHQYVVVLRIPDGLDRAVEPPCWFLWTARRQARKTWEREWREQNSTGPVVLERLAVDIDDTPSGGDP